MLIIIEDEDYRKARHAINRIDAAREGLADGYDNEWILNRLAEASLTLEELFPLRLK
jgi:hypothetical protein